MGSRVIDPLDSVSIPTSVLHDGQGNEGDESNESHGCNESNEGHEEEACLRKACQTSCPLWQDRQDRNWIEEDRPCAEQDRQDCQQEEEPPWQEVTLDRSSSEGPEGTQDQGFRSCQEGHSTLQEGQGALRPVSIESMRNLLQMWGFLRLSSAGASLLESFGINDK